MNSTPQVFTYSASADRVTNKHALWGFVLAFIISAIGLALCIIGLRRSQYLNNREGRGLSIAGIIISSVALSVYIFLIVFIAIMVHGSPLY